ncbi:hypothetical protein POTOM_022086 [Populus tomentosa]|uniref:Uncharacterized protein n=1 Tax=Populus tomentosa TaxID=118781 RepID=A0A8X7ZT63_POPTO|nr:hypothetical protein POTOM_022086 [Populus tomentosa]
MVDQCFLRIHFSVASATSDAEHRGCLVAKMMLEEPSHLGMISFEARQTNGALGEKICSVDLLTLSSIIF